MNLQRQLHFRKIIFLVFIFVTFLFLVSCGGPDADETPTSDPSPVPATAEPTIPPTETPAPGVSVLVAPITANPQVVQNFQSVLGELSGNAGLLFETRENLNPGDISPEWKVVSFLAPPPNLSDLVNGAPSTQFIVLSEQDLETAPNLNVIRMRPEHQAFVAGYISVLVAPDWRAAGLLPADEPFGNLIADAYVNGGRYFCGICNPVYAPLVRFPLTYSLPSGTDFATWQSAVNELQLNYIYVYYLAPEVMSNDLLAYLAGLNTVLLGGSTPPDELRSRWAGTVTYSKMEAVRELFPSVISGEGGQTINAKVQVVDVNPAYLSDGRLRIVEEVIRDLESGLIYPLTIP